MKKFMIKKFVFSLSVFALSGLSYSNIIALDNDVPFFCHQYSDKKGSMIHDLDAGRYDERLQTLYGIIFNKDAPSFYRPDIGRKISNEMNMRLFKMFKEDRHDSIHFKNFGMERINDQYYYGLNGKSIDKAEKKENIEKALFNIWGEAGTEEDGKKHHLRHALCAVAYKYAHSLQYRVVAQGCNIGISAAVLPFSATVLAARASWSGVKTAGSYIGTKGGEAYDWAKPKAQEVGAALQTGAGAVSHAGSVLVRGGVLVGVGAPVAVLGTLGGVAVAGSVGAVKGIAGSNTQGQEGSWRYGAEHGSTWGFKRVKDLYHKLFPQKKYAEQIEEF